MARCRDLRTISTPSVEIDPVALADVPSGSDGQIAIVTDNAICRAYVRESGSLVPIVDVNAAQRTTEAITITVDYATGVSPPEGTVVHNQAEATALGTLKYVQDAVDVLPTFLGGNVTISVAAGTHYAKLNNCEYSTAMLRMRPFTSLGWFSYINIQGQVSVVESGITGTLSAYTFVRSSGTWVAGALSGKFLKITTGAGIGSILAIRDNTEDTVYFEGYVWTVGAATVTIQESSTILLSDPSGDVGYDGIYAPGAMDYNLRISDCCLGTSTSRFALTQLYNGTITLVRCVVSGCIECYGDASFYSYASIFHGDSSDYAEVLYFKTNGMVFFYGGWADTNNPSYNILVLSSGYVYLYSFAMSLITGASDDSGCIRVVHGGRLVFQSLGQTHHCRLDGGGLGDGLVLEGSLTQITGGEYAVFINCLNAFKATKSYLSTSAIGNASCSGNVVGYSISDNSEILIDNIANLSATTYGMVDEIEVFATDFASDGDSVTGPGGSILGR